MSRRLQEAFGLDEADDEEFGEPRATRKTKSGEDDRRMADPRTAQRNVPREMANAISKSPPYRYTVWQIKRLPQGTQAARLLRYMEDKGWRRAKISGKDVFFHARSFKLLEPSEVKNWTLDDLYSIFRPRSSDDGEDARALDSSLNRLWGMRTALGASDGSDITVSSKPSEEFLKFISSPGNMQQAEHIADLFFQHTGIVIEPLGAILPRGKTDRSGEDLADLRNQLADLTLSRDHATDPDERKELDAQIADLKGQMRDVQGQSQQAAAKSANLPQGVDPEDIVVMAERGSMYVVRAKDHAEGVLHDSSRVIVHGKTTAKSRGVQGKLAAHTDADVGADDNYVARKYGSKPTRPGPTKSDMTATPQGVQVPKAWLDQKPKASTPDHPRDPGVKVEGDGTLTKAVQLAAKEGREFLYLMSRSEVAGKKGAPADRIPTTPGGHQIGDRLEPSEEPRRVAGRLQLTGGLPVKPGKWKTSQLAGYLRIFERYHGTRL